MVVPLLVRCLRLYCFSIVVHATASPLSHRSSNSHALPISPSPLQNHSFPLTAHNYSHAECVSSHVFIKFQANFSYRSARWPDFPYRYDLPGTQQTQWLQFTSSIPHPYGSVARTLLLDACDQMIRWLRGQTLGEDVQGWHYVSDDVVDGRGISHSSYFDLRPETLRGRHLTARLALDATIALKELVGRYGAFTGRFEIWQFANLKGISEVAVIEWPPARGVNDQ